jgi:hypothetical protein
MRVPTYRALAALVLLAAACGDAPTAPTAAAGGPSLNTGTALSATVTCPSSFNYGSTYDCTAVASGGSGTGYTFSWHSGSEYYDQGGTSKAYVPCNKYYSSGYPSSGYLTAYGTVTDSNGTSTYFSLSRSC